jgi:SRSO17 transposase
VAGLTAAELARIRGRLEAFAEDLFASLPRADQRARGQCYLRGLMLEGRRKSIQPMATRLGEVQYQALHHFVAVSPWDWGPVRRRLAEVLCGARSPTAWVVDDTGFPKDGDCSVGVQRQYSGTLGKTANCQLGVSVNAVTEHACCPLDWRLLVPERWDEDVMATRRAACHLPERVQHRPKWRLVLDMLDELAGWELAPPVLLADSGYGEVGEFRWGLDARQVAYVVEVRADTSAYPEQVRPTVAPHKGRGRRPRPRYREAPSSLTELATAGEQACVELIWRRGSKGLQRGRFLALRVRPAGVTPAGWHERPTRSCRCAGCWPNGPMARPSRSSTGCRTCPRPPRWWSWCGWPGCAGEWSRITASSRGAWGWIISRVAAGLAGTTTSRWSRSRTAS